MVIVVMLMMMLILRCSAVAACCDCFPHKSSTVNKQGRCLSLTQRENSQESLSSLPLRPAPILARRVVLRKRDESVLCSTAAINNSFLYI